MGLRINTNVLSLTAQRNLQRTSKSFGKALERLASGSRVNRAGDDAAGLAISEGLNSQVRGVTVAIRNANDAIGFLNTAEGALSELTNIAQRLRELGIQAANGTLSNVDRGYLDEEADALLAEFSRIASQTEFNGVKLLDGSFTTTDLQVGVSRGETIGFTIGDARASSLGALAVMSGVQHYITSAAASITINNVVISAPASGDDAVSNRGNSYSAMALAAAINEKRGETGVRGVILDNIVNINDISFGNFSGTLNNNDFKINGVSITGSGITTVGALVDAINEQKNATGVTAELNSNGSGGDDINLVAEDGRNIDVTVTNNTTSTGFWQVIDASTNMGAVSNIVTATTALSTAGIDRILTGAIKLTSSSIITLASSASATLGFSGTSFLVDETTSLDSVDISTKDDAEDSLEKVDATLSELNELRARLGAVQNRLESVVNNLSITLENISAARSQIKDADIAAETAELTRSQILQQAGVAVLGQANTSSQVALSLLNF